jgi:hypothetical protein
VRVGTNLVSTWVGYVKKAAPPGYSMIANPLETLENTLEKLLPDVPEGTMVYKWIEGTSLWRANSYRFGAWDDPAMTLHPGEGVIVRNVSGAPFTIAFAGEVNLALHNRVPLGEAIRSSAIPQAGLVSSGLGYAPFGPGGQIMRMTDPRGGYTVYTYDEDGWSPSEPVIELGEAFWCRNPVNAFIWERILRSPQATREGN